ncbi:MAG: rod shape-determining protein RodA [Bdellovibrionaceae bacterium]|nr:rod shape-determining protein RodA [Pseudobdellovibrionaceae bacterium]MDW8190248.1 rod shape-determining protein RodA [Pseudobdellovibrionaceae bacterium]
MSTESLEASTQRKSLFKKIDWIFVYTLLALTIISLINLYSATHRGSEGELNELFFKQVIYFVIGWILFAIFTFVNPSLLENLSIILYLLNLLLIIFVTFFGKVALGAQRWIHLGFFNFQPSETMKIATLFLLAKILARIPYQTQGLGIKALILPLTIIFLPALFIIKQPDLGTALILTAINGTVILFYGVRKSIVVSLLGFGLVAAPLTWEFVLHDYQKQRVYTFLSPDSDPRGSGYNSIQSKIAVGSGQVFGKGYQAGTQSKLEFLPERHTDFIFSVLSEEHGFIGSFGVILLFGILLVISLRIASTAIDRFQALVAVGIIAYLFWHILVNIGMVIGLLPIVGVPLLLFSYGGSSLLTTMISLGILSGIAYRRYLF